MADTVTKEAVEAPVGMDTPAPEPKQAEKVASASDPISTSAGEEQWKSDLSAAYDRIAAGKQGEPEEPEPEQEASAKADEKPAAEAEKDDEKPEDDAGAAEAKADKEGEGDDADADQEALKTFPATLPKKVRDHWGKIPEEARKLIGDHERALSAKLAEQGRETKGIAPIRDVLIEAAQRFPTMANMKPEEVAQRVMQTSETIERLNSDPVGTLLQEAQHRGVLEQMAQILHGQRDPEDRGQEQQQLRQHIAGLERKLAQFEDPGFWQSKLEEQRTHDEIATASQVVEAFKAEAEHWPVAEPFIPQYVAILKQREPGLPQKELLSSAYSMALRGLGIETADNGTGQASPPLPTPSPVTADAQIRAKSVNVRSRTPAQPAPLSLQDELSRVYDKASRRHI